MFGLSHLQSLVQVGLELLLECVHLILLFGDQFSLGSDDLLLSFMHVLFTFQLLHLLALHLHFVGLLVIFLLGQGSLHLLLVEQFAAVFKIQRQLFFEHLSILLNFLSVSVLQST